MLRLKVNDNEFYCSTAESIFVLIKQFAGKDFWDDVINDEAGQEINIIDWWYKAADVLKSTDRKYYDELCEEYWQESKQDVIDEINAIGVNQIVTIYGFEVMRLEDV